MIDKLNELGEVGYLDTPIASELAGAYLQGIHRIMEKYSVDTEMYRELKDCFDELGIQPSTDVEDAIKYAAYTIRKEKLTSRNSARMCWSFHKDRLSMDFKRSLSSRFPPHVSPAVNTRY